MLLMAIIAVIISLIVIKYTIISIKSKIEMRSLNNKADRAYINNVRKLIKNDLQSFQNLITRHEMNLLPEFIDHIIAGDIKNGRLNNSFSPAAWKSMYQETSTAALYLIRKAAELECRSGNKNGHIALAFLDINSKRIEDAIALNKDI